MILLFSALIAIISGTLVEYWLHRGIHEWGIFHHRHMQHHKDNDVDENWVLDFLFFYLPIALPFIIPGLFVTFFLGWWFFFGWLVGGILYVLLFSWCHFVQHNHPEKVFWMKMPIHNMHHRRCKGNYGVTVDWWDRLFGTYKI